MELIIECSLSGEACRITRRLRISDAMSRFDGRLFRLETKI